MKNSFPNHLPQSHNLAKRVLRQEVIPIWFYSRGHFSSRTKASPVEMKRFPPCHHYLLVSPAGGRLTCPNLRLPVRPGPPSPETQVCDPPRLPPTRQGARDTAHSAPSAAAGRYPTNRYARLAPPSVCVTRLREAELPLGRTRLPRGGSAPHSVRGVGAAALYSGRPELARGGGAGPPAAPFPQVRAVTCLAPLGGGGRGRRPPAGPGVPRMLAVTSTRAGASAPASPSSVWQRKGKSCQGRMGRTPPPPHPPPGALTQILLLGVKPRSRERRAGGGWRLVPREAYMLETEK